MKNFLNNKFNLIIILLVAIILGFGSSVFASYEFTYNDVEYSLPDLPRDDTNFIILSNSSYYYVYYFSGDVDNLYFGYEGSDFCAYYYSSNSCSYTLYHLSINSTNWVFERSSSFNRGLMLSGSPLYSTFDLKDNNGNVVFQGAPQEQAQELTLVPIVEQAEMEKTMAEILGILPLVVSLLVSIIAIRKAISFLRNVLKTS